MYKSAIQGILSGSKYYSTLITLTHVDRGYSTNLCVCMCNGPGLLTHVDRGYSTNLCVCMCNGPGLLCYLSCLGFGFVQ